MKGNKFTNSPSFWVSIALIVTGVYLLLENLGYYYIADIWDFWPLILIIIGAVKLIGSNFKDIYSSGILIVIGVLLLLISLNFLDAGDILQFWPLVLILIGAKIIWNHYHRISDRRYDEKSYSENRIDAVAIFGGKKVNLYSDKFEGGNITTLFGGSEVRLEKSKLAPGKNILDVFVMFGGAEIYVPQNWHVITEGFPIFGGFEDNRGRPEQEDFSPESALIIKGIVVFGGIEIKRSY